MKQKSIAQSMKDFAHDKELMRKTHDSAAIRAKKRERKRIEKLAKRKKRNDIIFFSLYGSLLIYFTAVVSWLFMNFLDI